ncbi:hypothetical protein RCH09_002421 [Actimicrobium sp. GrIS 1.19]|uniref:hypothetical protein n=1 Tax=Actimicrobium sp. GrIS 1.19 TaxID=3071708 RepID=UPI002E0A40E2|nr:hypothetical protein [Actimicrobium sp. GrIS 1.19]
MPDDTTSPIRQQRRRSTDRTAPVAPARPKRSAISVGLIISVLLHALVLWLILTHKSPPMVKPPGKGDVETTLLLLPNTPDKSSKASKPRGIEVPPLRPSKPRKTKAPRAPQAISRPPNPNAITEPAEQTAPPRPPVEQPPEEDFSSRLASKQRQRAEAEAAQQAERGTPQQQDDARGKAAAMANITSALKAAGVEKESGGGMFQLGLVGAHHAEFLFRGWKKEASRNWSQQLSVEQGAEEDIRIAVVKKMIDIIRQHTQEDFTWDSHKLGRQVSLSARTEDLPGLQQFLLREFFPDYSPTRR